MFCHLAMDHASCFLYVGAMKVQMSKLSPELIAAVVDPMSKRKPKKMSRHLLANELCAGDYTHSLNKKLIGKVSPFRPFLAIWRNRWLLCWGSPSWGSRSCTHIGSSCSRLCWCGQCCVCWWQRWRYRGGCWRRCCGFLLLILFCIDALRVLCLFCCRPQLR